MFGMNVKIDDTTHRVKVAADKAVIKNVRHAAGSVMKEARKSIQRAPKVKSTVAAKVKTNKPGKKTRTFVRRPGSPPGTPPYTKRGQLKRAIKYSADKDNALIGPEFSLVGTSGEAHEFGGEYKGGEFDERAFMEPALDRVSPRFAASFSGSIGS